MRNKTELNNIINGHLKELRQILNNNHNINTVTMTVNFTLEEIVEIADSFLTGVNHEEDGTFCVITVYSISKDGHGLLICKTPKA